jgi:glycosyltransferase involved in cell wall biosynthesis
MNVTYDLIYFSLQSFGGISRMWMELFKQLPDANINPTFIIGPAENMAQDYLEQNNFFGGTVVQEEATGFYQKLRRLGFYRNLHLMGMNPKGDERIFHSTDYINPLISRKSLRVVTTIHDMVFWDQSDRFVRNIWYYDKLWCTYHACRTSDRVITVSESAKQRILVQFPWVEEKITVIYHGLDESLLNVEFKINKEKRFLFIGGRNTHKNFDLLAEAFAVFCSDYPDWQLHLVGPNAHSLEREQKLFANLDITDKVTDHGMVSQEKLTSLLQSSAALVIPSLNEGFNFPLLEGMAAGCPVLSSDIPVSRELGEGRARFFPANSKTELIKQLRLLVDNPATPQELTSNQEYARSFRWKNSFDALKKVYRECLG